MRRIAIITGASAGLGAEFAKQIDEKYDLSEIWLIARRKDRLEALSSVIKRAKPVVISGDLTKPETINRMISKLENGEDYRIQLLVNNAGFGYFGSFLQPGWEKYKQMIDLNVTTVVETCYKLLPYIADQDTNDGVEAGIINIASSAGFQPANSYNVYAATKAFVLNFSAGLYGELKKSGIKVTAVCPGPVKTEFFDVATHDQNATFNMESLAASPEEVVKTALNDFSRRGRFASIHGFAIKLFTTFSRFIPRKVIGSWQ